MSDSDGSNCFELSCDELRLSIEFSLNPGEFGRIGSSPEMEISLPLLGLAQEECSLFLDGPGLLWLTRAGSNLRIRIDLPSYFRAGPYKFLIREKLVESVTPPPAPTTKLQARSIEATHERRRPSKITSEVGIMAGSIVFLALGVTFWFASRDDGKKAGEGKRLAEESHSVAEKIGANQPAAPATVSKAEKDIPPKPAEVGVVAAPPAPVVPANPGPTLEPERLDLQKLASTVAPCVFLIQVMDATGTMTATGTGFSVSADGLVATNFHVIEHGQTFTLVTGQGAKFDQAQIVVEDPDSDLAILKIDAKRIPFLSLATTSNVPVGKRVAVYGSPQGLAGTFSEGIISASPRNLTDNLPDEPLPNRGVLIQTTAAISHGSSGSPLFDAEGAVLGVMTLNVGGAQNSQNLNFAVPVEALKSLIGKATNQWSFYRPNSGTSILELPKLLPRERQEAASYDPAFGKLREKIDAAEWVEALKMARTLTEKHPKSVHAHFQHAYCASMLRLDQQAETSYMKAIEIEPGNQVIWNNLGLAVRNQNQPQKALVAFEKSVALKPDYALAWSNLVTTNVILANWSKAATALDTLSQLDLKLAKEHAKMLSGFRFPDSGFNLAVKRALSKKVGNLAANGPLKFRVVGVAAADPLTVRSGPGVTFSQVTSIANGTEVFVVGEGKMNGSTEWLPIEFQNWSGWVASKFLEALD